MSKEQIKGIPVTFNGDYERLIGRATIGENDEITFKINGNYLTQEIKRLITLDQIRGFSLIVTYKLDAPREESEK